MLGAKITNWVRRDVYRRDGYMCAICGDTRALTIHHCIQRSVGGSDTPQNLITLCPVCHALAHGIDLNQFEEAYTQDDMQLAIVEYLADYYAGEWYPYSFPNEYVDPNDAKPP